MSPEQFDRNRRARLQTAMLEAVAQHGYPATTVSELVKLAGVSNSTFYENFRNKQECFFSTSEAVVEWIAARVAEAYRQPTDFRGRLTAGLSAFLRVAAEQPAGVSLVIVDSLTVGAAGVEHRENASEAFVALLERGLSEAPGSDKAPMTTARAVVCGVRGVAYWRLRADRQDELPGSVDQLIDWALCYRQPLGELAGRAAAAARDPAPRPAPQDPPRPGWDEPADSRRSRRALTQRERIIRATAQVAFDGGYDALSIPAISGAAGVSNKTFYEHFAGKSEAFLAAFEALAAETVAVAATALASGGRRPEALGIGIRALLEHIATNELFAKIAFFELSMGGPASLDRGDAILDAFTAFLEPGAITDEITHRLPTTVREAIGTAVWGVLQYEIYRGRRERLPELAPEIARLALAPIDCRLGE